MDGDNVASVATSKIPPDIAFSPIHNHNNSVVKINELILGTIKTNHLWILRVSSWCLEAEKQSNIMATIIHNPNYSAAHCWGLMQWPEHFLLVTNVQQLALDKNSNYCSLLNISKYPSLLSYINWDFEILFSSFEFLILDIFYVYFCKAIAIERNIVCGQSVVCWPNH